MKKIIAGIVAIIVIILLFFTGKEKKVKKKTTPKKVEQVVKTEPKKEIVKKVVKNENSKGLIVGKLPNGLTYYIYKNKKPKNNATLNLVVKAGSLMEDDNQRGLAHFTEHMAFNGTKKFKKNDMVKYLQSLGLSFGGDLNAYTTFDRTVYELQIPTTQKDLEAGIDVLKEWSKNLIFSPSEVDGEKNVVLEEWRLDQGLSHRMMEMQKDVFFKNSRYYDRFPIGKPEIIKGAKRDLLVKFYNKWYIPQNMAVVVVGDVNPNNVVKLIKKDFDYPKSEKNSVPPIYELAKLTNKFVVFKDPEIRFTDFTISKLAPKKIITSRDKLRDTVIDGIIDGIVSSRITKLTTSKNSPLISGYMSQDDMTKNQQFIDVGVRIKNNQIKDGVKTIISLMKSLNKNGITPYEFDVQKDEILSNLKNFVANKDSITNSQYAQSIVDLAMYGTIFLDPNDEYKAYQDLLKNITIEDINNRIHKIYGMNSAYVMTTNSKTKLTNKELQNVIDTEKNSDIYKDYSLKAAKLVVPEHKSGEIKKVIKLQDENKYILSNGMEVIVKNTNFDKDNIIIKLFKKEGSSVDNCQNFVDSRLATRIIKESGASNLLPEDIGSYMKGKTFMINPYIDTYVQGMDIISDKENLENALNYMTALIYAPKVDKNVFNNIIMQTKQSIATRNNSPLAVYYTEMKKVYTGNAPRFMPITLKQVKKITKKGVLQEFKNKFGNFYGYKLIIVGSLDGVNVDNILKTYFAGLTSKKNNNFAREIKTHTPKNIVIKTVKKGIDEKATTTIIFPYRAKYGYVEHTLYSGLADILDMVFIENIREKIGGVYSIWATTTLSPNTYGQNRLVISYSSDPKRVVEIRKAVIKSVKDTLTKKIDKEKIDSVVKNYKINYDIYHATNVFWAKHIYNKLTIPNYKLATPEEFKELLTQKNLQKYNKKAVKLSNYLDIVLVPENK